MPQHKSAIKRLRQSKKRNAHNRARRSTMKTLMKSVLESTEKVDAEKKLREAVSFIDRVSLKGILHKNTAARKKARLTNHVNQL